MKEKGSPLPIPTEDDLTALREMLRETMSEKRYRHTLGVERMAACLGELFCPDQIPLLRAAALLHDITKEETFEKQLQLCQQFGIIIDETDRLAPKTFHAKTAAALIPVRYEAFAHPVVLDAVRWHTTGCAGMSLTAQLIYLADYIDDTRTFPDCVTLREAFWSADPAAMSQEERARHLRRVLITSFDMTISALLADGDPISSDTFLARNHLILMERKQS